MSPPSCPAGRRRAILETAPKVATPIAAYATARTMVERRSAELLNSSQAPDAVARTVLRMLSARRMRAVERVGKDVRSSFWARRLTSARLYERMVRRYYRIDDFTSADAAPPSGLRMLPDEAVTVLDEELRLYGDGAAQPYKGRELANDKVRFAYSIYSKAYPLVATLVFWLVWSGKLGVLARFYANQIMAAARSGDTFVEVGVGDGSLTQFAFRVGEGQAHAPAAVRGPVTGHAHQGGQALPQDPRRDVLGQRRQHPCDSATFSALARLLRRAACLHGPAARAGPSGGAAARRRRTVAFDTHQPRSALERQAHRQVRRYQPHHEQFHRSRRRGADRQIRPADRGEHSQRAPVADQGPAGRRGHLGGPTMTPVLQLEGVFKKYRRGDEEVHALVDFDFTLEAGEFVVVTGPSGAGKSTLLHIAGGLDAPDAGTVAVAGQDVWAMSAGARAAFRRRNLGFVFQFFNLVPMLTAVENVSLPLVLDGVPARAADARAEELLERVGLGDRARHRPAELSGGQMQRVAVARALAARPSIILADEPTGNLDSQSSTEVLGLLRSLADEDGAAVVVVTHDQAAVGYGSRELHLVDGRERVGHDSSVGER